MSHRVPSLWQFLDHHVIARDTGQQMVRFREQLDQSELLAAMGRIADEVNTKAGNLLIDVQSYLPPEALVRSFCFGKDGQDYVLQLESWGPKPTVVFLSRKWRRLLFMNSLDWVYRCLGVEEYVIDVKFSSLFRPEQVSEADVENWFTYLISGFDRAFAPTVPQEGSVASAQALRKQAQPIVET
ncbi:MAG: hypothetical protein WBV36_02660 [Terriglobales bacterium]